VNPSAEFHYALDYLIGGFAYAQDLSGSKSDHRIRRFFNVLNQVGI
jgi:hypothetical protein